MPELSRSRQHQEVFGRLVRLSGHLDVSASDDDDAVRALQEALAGAVADEDLAAARSRSFFVERSDLFFDDRVAEAHRDRLDLLASHVAQQTAAPDLRVFVRDVGLRSAHLAGSVPGWAAGAAVDHTLGPFRARDGRHLWFDFFKITRLVALYLAGQAEPALLLDVPQRKHVTLPHLPLAVDPLPRYQLSPDSVWVKSTLLASNAPAGTYTGFRISSGEVVLGAPPTLVNGQLTVPAQVTVTVTLVLEQPGVTDADPASPYGEDARDGELHLPKRLTFHFSTASHAIDAVTGRTAWRTYGQSADFEWHPGSSAVYDPRVARILVPLTCSQPSFEVLQCASPFTTYAGHASVLQSAWALPIAAIDVTKPSPAAGIGGLAVQTGPGLSVHWPGLDGGDIQFHAPFIVHDPGRFAVIDLQAGNAFCTQEYALWTDAVNPHGTSVGVQYTAAFPFAYSTEAAGNEALLAFVNANPRLDRPVNVTGQPFAIHSKGSTLVLAMGKALKLIYLFDDNILFDNYDPKKPVATAPKPAAIALHNALFKVTPVNGCLLFGQLTDDLIRVERGIVFLTFGMYAYLPTLPDPYAANLNVLRSQFRRSDAFAGLAVSAGPSIWLWLVSQIRWEFQSPDTADVDVSFHFAPLQDQTGARSALAEQPFSRLLTTPAATAPPEAVAPTGPATGAAAAAAGRQALATQRIDWQAVWDGRFGVLHRDAFALLDVSSHANQMGVSFGSFGDRRMGLLRTQAVAPADEFPIQAQGMDVSARGTYVRAFTTPQISWEPLLNLTYIDFGDPPLAHNYFPDDGGPTRMLNNSVRLVPLAPIPVCDFLVSAYANEPGNLVAAEFTLPFGMRSLATLNRNEPDQAKEPTLEFNRPSFADDMEGGIQLSLGAGSGFSDAEGDMFRGFTAQINNIRDWLGNDTGTATLGAQVTQIFNQRFFTDTFHGVPLTRIDLSGYGASTASRWLKSDAQFADVSQSVFDVFVGRTGHEVVQVKSMIYPWGIKVVRTVTIFRVGSGYVYRVDSGWKAESDGRFDFRFKYVTLPDPPGAEATAVPYKIHPGVVKGLFNIRNIRPATADVLPYTGTMDVTAFYEIGSGNKPKTFDNFGPPSVAFDLQPVYFDADVELDNVVQGHAGGRVPARKILGFVQLSPRGIPITPAALKGLLDRQLGSVGGPLDAIMDIGFSGQHLRINRVDVNSSVDAAGIEPVFVAASKGSVILPKDGSWSLVAHAHQTGEVTPLPEGTPVPVIRVGELAGNMTYPRSALLRVANPADLLRAAGNQTINYGFLQSTNTQKALFLTPAFDSAGTLAKPGLLLSKTPPLFVDAYRLIGSKAIFPNVGNAVTTFGDAIPLTKNFNASSLMDGGKAALKLAHINSEDEITRLKQEGYKLANAVKQFDLPTTAWDLINEDYLRVYVEYKATTENQDKTPKARIGVLDYDFNSFAANVADTWKSRMNNLAMVVDLGSLKRLMTIKGNFDAKKGSEASYTGAAGDPDFASPQIEFSDALKPVIEILQILADLQGAKYADAVKKGLKVAMSNSAGGWEYKFEASKEFPLLKFPVPDEVYNNPNTPLKLEASMKIGVYFNAALMTAALNDPKKLLPTAGAFLEFYGRLSVMCVSLSAATIYAVGQANVRLAADTKVGPSLMVKFGFGAQIVVGLPVVGHVSLLYVVGVEIYADAGTVKVSAFLLFQGHAELLGGLVSVTITIEAKGSVSRTTLPAPNESDSHTDMEAQVTFGLDISIFLVINISFSKSWSEQRQIA